MLLKLKNLKFLRVQKPASMNYITRAYLAVRIYKLRLVCYILERLINICERFEPPPRYYLQAGPHGRPIKTLSAPGSSENL